MEISGTQNTTESKLKDVNFQKALWKNLRKIVFSSFLECMSQGNIILKNIRTYARLPFLEAHQLSDVATQRQAGIQSVAPIMPPRIAIIHDGR